MKSYRWDGTTTALSSIAHGGETLGTITYLRREAFLTPSGRVDVPVISGNAVRGVLRDSAAHLLWNALGCPKLSLPVMHALWSGGALVKAKNQPLTGQRLADLRRMVAHVGVFGVAGGGRIIDGALTVGKLVPVCTQTAHVLPEHLTAGADLPDIHDLLQIERYSRVPDADRLTEILADPDPDDETTDPDSVRMRYGAETFIAGTQFHTMFALTNTTADEHDFFADVLDTWLPTATVGGKIGRGHGRVHMNLNKTGPAEDAAGDWRSFGGSSPDEVLTSLSWLD